MYRRIGKRIIDILISTVGLLVLLFPIIIIAILIKLDSKGPVIFVQKRLGKNIEEFKIYKFRTMIIDAYKIGGTNTYEDDPRITKVGRFLRKTSLDEILQFVNILKGDMSIIGPRPILAEEFVGYEDNDTYMSRYKILPGMFCTVDLEHRAEASRELQFEMDAEYVKNMSFMYDVRIFFRIIKTVILGENVYKTKENTK